MKKNDGRRLNDNSRVYHEERIEKIKNAIKDVCEGIKSRGEADTFAHIAKTMKESYEKPILVSEQTLRENSEYRQIIDEIFKKNFDNLTNIKIRKHDPKSNAELKNEIYKVEVKLAKCKSDNKILKHQIKQSNISSPDYSYNTADIQVLEQLEMSNTSLLQLVHELSKLGDFFWDREGFKRASDGKIFLTQKGMLLMGIEPQKLLEYFPKK